MQDSIGVLFLVVVALVVLRLPFRRTRSIRVESRIGNAALDFDPLSPAPPPERPGETIRAPVKDAPQLPAAPRTGKPTSTRTAAPSVRRAAPRKRKHRKR